MNITSIKANLLDLVCDIFSLGTPNYDRTQVESAIDLLYEVIIYRQQDSSIDDLALRLMELCKDILEDDQYTANNLDLLSTKLEPFLKKIEIMLGNSVDGKNLCALLKSTQINNNLTTHNYNLNTEYAIAEPQYLYYISESYKIRNEIHNAKQQTNSYIRKCIVNVYVVYVYVILTHFETLKKIVDSSELITNPISIQEGEWIYDYIMYGKTTTSIKNSILNAYIINCLFDTRRILVDQLREKCGTYFKMEFNPTYFGKILKDIGPDIIKRIGKDEVTLTDSEYKRVNKIKEDYKDYKDLFDSYFVDILQKYHISLSAKDQILKDLLGFFSKQYFSDDKDQIDDIAFLQESIAKLCVKDVKSLVVDLFMLCKQCDYVKTISACQVLTHLMDIERYQYVLEPKKIFVDTQFILYCLCLDYAKYPKFWDEEMYLVTRDLCEESRKHPNIELCFSKHYLPEVVHHMKSALNLIAYEKIFSVTKGLSANIFYKYFIALKDALILDAEITFAEFMYDRFGVSEEDLYNKHIDDICSSAIINILKGHVKIFTLNHYSFFDNAKTAFNDACETYSLRKKTPYTLKNDAIMLSALADISTSTSAPIFLTWDKTFPLANKIYKDLFCRNNDAVWHIFTPTKFFNNVSLFNLKIDQVHLSDAIMSVLNKDLSNTTKTIYDCHNKLLDIKNIPQEQRRKYIMNIKSIFNDEEFNFGDIEAREKYNLILDEIINTYGDNIKYRECLLDEEFFTQVITVIKNGIKTKQSVIADIDIILNNYIKTQGQSLDAD